MIPALARATSELTGLDVPESAFRRDTVAAYLRLTCRLVDENGKVVGQSREIDDLLKQHGARARGLEERRSAARLGEEGAHVVGLRRAAGVRRAARLRHRGA
jgi:ATP-dependent helicase HrpA